MCGPPGPSGLRGSPGAVRLPDVPGRDRRGGWRGAGARGCTVTPTDVGRGRRFQNDQRYRFLSAFLETAERNGNSLPAVSVLADAASRGREVSPRPREATPVPRGAAHIPSCGSMLMWTCPLVPAQGPRAESPGFRGKRGGSCPDSGLLAWTVAGGELAATSCSPLQCRPGGSHPGPG